jgi:hypothetical protein
LCVPCPVKLSYSRSFGCDGQVPLADEGAENNTYLPYHTSAGATYHRYFGPLFPWRWGFPPAPVVVLRPLARPSRGSERGGARAVTCSAPAGGGEPGERKPVEMQDRLRRVTVQARTHWAVVTAAPRPCPAPVLFSHCFLQTSALAAMSLSDLVPLPALVTRCGRGVGLAVCSTLGLLVTSNTIENTLRVFALPSGWPSTSDVVPIGAPRGAGAGAGAGLALLCTLGGAGSPAPMQFQFVEGGYMSGWMAFTGPPTSRLLLVTDAGHDAVHVIDVAGRVHAGYVAAPGTIASPRGVAARGSLVAVSAWKKSSSGEHVVRVFEGSGAMWTALRVLAGGFRGLGSADGQLKWPLGLRFTGDGTGLAVVDYGNGRVSLFRVEDGSFARHVATRLSHPFDVEECAGGWLVACRRPVARIPSSLWVVM